MSGAVLPASAPLLSVQWFRVAALRPKLDPQAQAERMVIRSQTWHVLVRADGSRSFRLNAAAWGTVARCDGRHTVQRLWEIALAELGDDAPTQDELLDILARLHGAGLMSFDASFAGAPDFRAASAGPGHPAPPQAAARRNSLLAWRIPLGNPDTLLARLEPHVRGLFSPLALALWLAGVGLAALQAWVHAAEIAALWHSVSAAPRMWWMAWLAYPVVKALHELAHGIAARHWGARVPEWGCTLLMFIPVPYVDASAASALPRRGQRLLVSAAGIVVELGLAALALGLALALQPGALRDAAMAVFFIGALSTLLVNANPLMRFDGYYMLCDALGVPNLATRSARLWLDRLRGVLLGLPGAAAVAPAPGEAGWLWAYAPAALAMRWAVAASVSLWLASVSFALGVAAAAYFGWMLLGAPLVALWRWLDAGAGAGAGAGVMPQAQRAGARRRTVWAAVALGLVLAALPLPHATVVQGVLGLPEPALVRALTDGFIDDVLVTEGQTVQEGEALLRLRAPAVHAERERLLGRVQMLQAEQEQALRADPAHAVAVEHALQTVGAELAQTDERLALLTVRARVAGRVTIAVAHAAAPDLPGRYVERGALLGHVMSGEPGLVQVAIPHERAALVAAHRGGVDVRRADASAPLLRGTWTGTSSGGGALLPNAALGERSGGRIATDAADPRGLRSAQTVVIGEVRLERALDEAADKPVGKRVGERVGGRVGERVLVRFNHGTAPLAWQAARSLQQQVLRHFNPAQ